ncbi:hypothetical protein AVENLUH5627_00595 [Acinetobacter venetianus]|uniref:GmrSD restriction endonucleases N-terminal domain-containing protein n=1 Tax=Acinetobacter venetianus TaxID=52133 RepID=A0A150I1D4_9GAMM|nr:DUF262 domain-containing protein [Acinetobacter venetianus]KXZ73439.1 hypothetical protein AVENLUH5627_00595 [Acinetobacter venetianus]
MSITQELLTQISSKRNEIHSDAYPMSIGELANLYKDGELDIHPEFQREYRWTLTQKTRLIESILLGIPLPSFFVSQRDDGIWDVVDGLQRLSTIFSFMGIYKNENDEIEDPLVLNKTDYLPALENLCWDDSFKKDDNHHALPKDMQITLKREKVDLKILKKESSTDTKYELFHRLNTFGSSLSPQEVRNCLLIMTNKELYKYIYDLSQDENFKTTISSITDRSHNEKFHLELITRFLILKDKSEIRSKDLEDVHEFLTKEILSIAKDETNAVIGGLDIFKKTFLLLNKALGENSFKRFDGEKYIGGFSLSIFEFLTLGLVKNLDSYDDTSEDIEKIREISQNLYLNDDFTRLSKSGTRASSRLPTFLNLAEEIFKK